MRKSSASKEESIRHHTSGGIFEVGSDYEQYSVSSANRFIKYIGKNPVVDLGCGDGAGTQVFVANGNPTTGVDVNKDKLDRVKGAKTVLTDFVSFLNKPVENIFMHHALEHYVDPDTVLKLIAKHLKPGGYCYIAVPKGGMVNSSHHVAFDGIEEIIPPGLEVIETGEMTDGWEEYYVICQK